MALILKTSVAVVWLQPLLQIHINQVLLSERCSQLYSGGLSILSKLEKWGNTRLFVFVLLLGVSMVLGFYKNVFHGIADDSRLELSVSVENLHE